GFTEGDLPDGPLVEEITAREFYEREAQTLACGWPALHQPKRPEICPCGFIFPGKSDQQWHDPALSAEDEEALTSRWMVCVGSVGMSEGQENKSTVFALEGTAAHEFNEFIITNGHDPRDWIGGLVDLQATGDELKFLRSGDNVEIDRERYFEIDEEMVEGCELTIETIEKYLSRVDGDEL
ncbi:hypothetical protein KXW37_003087, partial [Aspergillus fumigatus]